MLLSLLCEDLTAKISLLAKKYFGDDRLNSLSLVQKLSDVDPTPKKSYLDWICRQFKNGKLAQEDFYKTREQLETFHRIKSKLTNKDINQYDPNDLYAATAEHQRQSNREMKRLGRAGKMALPPGAKIVKEEQTVDGSQITAIEIATPQAASLLCSGTNWCVANEEAAEEYLEKGQLYLIYKDGERICLCHYETGQFMDPYDRPMTGRPLFHVVHFLESITGKSEQTDPHLAVKYAMFIGDGRCPKLEPIIAQNGDASIDYASDVLFGPFPLGEPAIAEDAENAYIYCKNVIQGPCPAVEKKIALDPSIARHYAQYIVKGPWPPGEKAIASQPDESWTYAKYVKDGRFPECEPMISQYASWSLSYAQNVLYGRFELGEPEMRKDPWVWRKYQDWLAEVKLGINSPQAIGLGHRPMTWHER